MPVRVRGEVFGALRVQGSSRGRFTPEDAELIGALAATAGLAVQNSRLYESARSRGRWLQASAAITQRLLSARGDDVEHPLRAVAESMRDVAGADLVAVVRPVQDPGSGEWLAVEVLLGPDDDDGEPGRAVPLPSSFPGRVYTSGETACVVDARLTPELGALPFRAPVGPALAVPLVGSGTVHGVLCAARAPGRPPFSATDVEMAGSFANQAAVAVELADARAERDRAVVLDERERIAADLHDTVVQRLFGVGLSLQGVLAELGEGRAADRVRATVGEVDATIQHIRSTLFPRDARAPDAGQQARDRLLDAVTAAVPVLGFEPDLRFGLLTGDLPADLAEDLVTVVREGLRDVADRGRARSVQIDVVQDRDGLVVHVRDDDTRAPEQPDDATSPLRARAERRGGTCTRSAGTPAGTSLYWWVPLR